MSYEYVVFPNGDGWQVFFDKQEDAIAYAKENAAAQVVKFTYEGARAEPIDTTEVWHPGL